MSQKGSKQGEESVEILVAKRPKYLFAQHVNTYAVIIANQMQLTLSPLTHHQTLYCLLRIFPPIWLQASFFKTALCVCFNQILSEKKFSDLT